MAYTELIKNFQRIRDYMREFYVYGFKSRDEFEKKSGRSYDDERRRIESYLGDYMGFYQTAAGKKVFLSIDSRNSGANPLYKALKAKSFTDRDITLHFILLDILHSPETVLTLNEILDRMEVEYLSCFQFPMFFDESTVRKKLKEYIELGILQSEKQGKQVMYRRMPSISMADMPGWEDAVAFFSEAGPCGAIGSFLLDRQSQMEEKSFSNAPCPQDMCASSNGLFSFKHHYITHTLESEVLCNLLQAIGERRKVEIYNVTRRSQQETVQELIPLRISFSVQNGRCYVLGCQVKTGRLCSYRLDYIVKVALKETVEPERFEQMRIQLGELQNHMWGVSFRNPDRWEHVEFTVHISKNEDYIYRRLEREKRCGRVEWIDDCTCRFTAEVCDTSEMIPWIRTFICRIVSMNFSNRTVENQFKKDLEYMYRLYGIEDTEDPKEVTENAVS